MTNEAVIAVEDLGKMYRIGREAPRRESLLGRVGQALTSPFDWLSSQIRGATDAEILWALKDVSFEVKRGEVLGVIGHNGAGKSTLLKILSRITEPTHGRAEIKGRVGSLLEIGTGMHPELTGRENIYLNGCILGMRRSEISQKFDEIVEFSDISKFLDTPVKRYSSGMRVRLGFAIAAHLEPEILLIDEVLAVGDAEFQKRCLGKMDDVAHAGRTVLFVSHNMAAITTLCPRSILLSTGELHADAATPVVIEAYYESLKSLDPTPCCGEESNPSVIFRAARILNSKGESTKAVDIAESFIVEMDYRIIQDITGNPVPNFHFYTVAGICCFVSSKPGNAPREAGDYRCRCHVPGHLLNEGTFSIGLAVTTWINNGRRQLNFFKKGYLVLTVRDPKIVNEHNHGWVRTVPGLFRPILEWEVTHVE